jgi:xylan 1,4-beta-xylosidase
MTNSFPVITGFHPDPTVCRAGDTYYLACSSFEYFPGIPLFRSIDLMHWEQVGNALTRTSQFDPTTVGPSMGIMAPTLRHHDGRFWLVTTNTGRFGDGIMMLTAENAEGPWSEPYFVAGTLGVDPDLAWDRDGNCYLTYSGISPAGASEGIIQARIEPETGALLEAPRRIWAGTGLAHPEGPHLYEVDGTWYLLIAEGGTERGHCVSVARAQAPRGPFAPCPDNPVLSHRSTANPVQNTGHADLIQTADGSWRAVLLAVRPHGANPGFHVLGRETFLADVTWEDGWPRLSLDLDLPELPASSFVETFSEDERNPRWIAPSDDPSRILAQDKLSPDENGSALLCTRVRDHRWSAQASFELGGGTARFVVRIDDRHWYGLTAGPDRITAIAQIGDVQTVIGSMMLADGRPNLRIAAVASRRADIPGAATGPDDIVLSAESGASVCELARLDGRYLSSEVAGGFTGRVLGIGAVDRPVRILTFTYSAGS